MSRKSKDIFFKPRARLLQLLGEQLIRDHRIALFELVKNSYDADSKSVFLYFYDIEDQKKARIVVKDTGQGMDLETVENIWFEPGADHKKIMRDEGKRTKKFKRLPVGEKGIGRFAAHKLGSKIELITRKANSKEVVVQIDWNVFSKKKYLNQTPIKVIERDPIVFEGAKSGTKITISELRQTWRRGEIRRLFRACQAMISPFKSNDPFRVKFSMNPDPGWLKGLLDAKAMNQLAMFRFKFRIDEEGFSYKYKFSPLRGLKADYKNEIKSRISGEDNADDFEFFNLTPPSRDDKWRNRKKRNQEVTPESLGIGPIEGTIICFDRDKEIMANYIPDREGLESYLDEQGGMRIYRDGVRVYDYGEPGNDWLGLDVRRVQIPTRRLSNNIIVGEVHLDLKSSQALEEKTNREGFVENEAYLELRYALICAAIAFERERAIDKKSIRDAFKSKTEDDSPENIDDPEDAIRSLKKRMYEANLEEKIGKEVAEVERTYKETREVLLSAVGTGLGLGMVFHEIERGVRDLGTAIEIGDPPERIKTLASHLSELLQGSGWLLRSSGRESIKASKLVERAIFAMAPRFDYHNVKLLNGFEKNPDLDFVVKGSSRMLVGSIVNLIDNSFHWLKVKRSGKKQSDNQSYIWIGPGHDLDGPAVIVADNGTGIKDPPEDIVRPFFSRKTDGMGLGLYFVNLTMKAHEGRLAFPRKNDVSVPAVCDGAIVAMVFRGE